MNVSKEHQPSVGLIGIFRAWKHIFLFGRHIYFKIGEETACKIKLNSNSEAVPNLKL